MSVMQIAELTISGTLIIERDMHRLFLGEMAHWLPLKKIYLSNTGTSVKAWDNEASFLVLVHDISPAGVSHLAGNQQTGSRREQTAAI